MRTSHSGLLSLSDGYCLCFWLTVMQWAASLLDCWTWKLNMGKKLCSVLWVLWAVLTAAHTTGDFTLSMSTTYQWLYLAPVWANFYICNICIDDCVQASERKQDMFPTICHNLSKTCLLTKNSLYTFPSPSSVSWDTSITPRCLSEAGGGIWGCLDPTQSALGDWQIWSNMSKASCENRWQMQIAAESSQT